MASVPLEIAKTGSSKDTLMDRVLALEHDEWCMVVCMAWLVSLNTRVVSLHARGAGELSHGRL